MKRESTEDFLGEAATRGTRPPAPQATRSWKAGSAVGRSSRPLAAGNGHYSARPCRSSRAPPTPAPTHARLCMAGVTPHAVLLDCGFREHFPGSVLLREAGRPGLAWGLPRVEPGAGDRRRPAEAKSGCRGERRPGTVWAMAPGQREAEPGPWRTGGAVSGYGGERREDEAQGRTGVRPGLG